MGVQGNNPAEPNLFLRSKEDGGLPHIALVTCLDTGKEPKTQQGHTSVQFKLVVYYLKEGLKEGIYGPPCSLYSNIKPNVLSDNPLFVSNYAVTVRSQTVLVIDKRREK